MQIVGYKYIRALAAGMRTLYRVCWFFELETRCRTHPDEIFDVSLGPRAYIYMIAAKENEFNRLLMFTELLNRILVGPTVAVN